MTAYLDNNILIELEQKKITKEELIRNINPNITKFFFSSAHLFEADEITGLPSEKRERLQRRFDIITELTENNYLYNELPTNVVLKRIQKPEIVYNTITSSSTTKPAMKSMVNPVSNEQKEIFRNGLKLNPIQINNYSPEEVIAQINEKRDAFGGFTLFGLIEEAKRIQSNGKPVELYDKIIVSIEMLDLIGYWKDKQTEKSNYARLWDGLHAYFSTFCDYFVSNDTRTRYKSKVVFETYGIKTKIVSMDGKI
ncbi:MAG: hypothetical protein ACH34V_06550 [Flavobacterium sp.]|uniref:hypothetical protein n=1 Tax=Flavobacterium sp. TaxID=239 RepID=UPI0037A125FF